MVPKIYLNNDLRGWGQNIFWELKKLGAFAQIVNNTNEILDTDGATMFMGLHHNAERLKKDMALAWRVHHCCPSVVMTPTLFECELYNNKARQHKEFPKYFPPTKCLSDKQAALSFIDNLSYPVITKCNDKAGGSGVKIIRSKTEATQATEAAFADDSPGGIIWQQFQPGNDGDYRVIVLANEYFWIAKRFAGNNDIVDGDSVMRHGVKHYRAMDTTTIKLLDYAYRFSLQNNLTRVAVDLIYDRNHNPIMTEFTTSWGTNIMNGGFWFRRGIDGGYRPTKYHGPDQYELIANLLYDGAFQAIACKQIEARQ